MLQHIFECEQFIYECEKLSKCKQTAIYVNKQLFVYMFSLIYPILKLYLSQIMSQFIYECEKISKK